MDTEVSDSLIREKEDRGTDIMPGNEQWRMKNVWAGRHTRLHKTDRTEFSISIHSTR
jgi:hypothetical protein